MVVEKGPLVLSLLGSAGRWMDGRSPSLFFLPPASRPACLVVVTATGPVIGGRGGKEGGRLLERSRWLVDLAGWYIGQALRVSFFFRRDGWILGGGREGGYKSVIVLAVRW